MDDLQHVRKRIQSRKRFTMDEQPTSSGFFRFLYRLMIVTMCIGVFALAILINQKMGLVKMPSSLQSLKLENISNWLPFENWFSLKEQTVASFPAYSLLEGDRYANGGNIAYSIHDGVVLHVQQKENGKGSVTIKHDNGVIATYGSLITISVKQDDRILKGNNIGTFEGSVSIIFMKNEKKIDLATALS